MSDTSSPETRPVSRTCATVEHHRQGWLGAHGIDGGHFELTRWDLDHHGESEDTLELARRTGAAPTTRGATILKIDHMGTGRLLRPGPSDAPEVVGTVEPMAGGSNVVLREGDAVELRKLEALGSDSLRLSRADR